MPLTKCQLCVPMLYVSASGLTFRFSQEDFWTTDYSHGMCCWTLLNQLNSNVKVTLRLKVSQSWYRAPPGHMNRLFLSVYRILHNYSRRDYHLVAVSESTCLSALLLYITEQKFLESSQILPVCLPCRVNVKINIWVWSNGRMILRGKPWSIEKKSALCQTQISHGLIRDQIRASVVRGQRLTAWAIVRPED